jgi:NAD(P)H dehydrogenase (quinone)
MGGFSGLLSQADNASPEITPPQGDRETARLYGKRLAEAAIRWVRGAQAPAVPLAA